MPIADCLRCKVPTSHSLKCERYSAETVNYGTRTSLWRNASEISCWRTTYWRRCAVKRRLKFPDCLDIIALTHKVLVEYFVAGEEDTGTEGGLEIPQRCETWHQIGIECLQHPTSEGKFSGAIVAPVEDVQGKRFQEVEMSSYKCTCGQC